MLEKNVWILYPQGYGGSYINWALSISDQDLATSTVADPINRTKSSEYGGQGTSHLHVRVPTHQGIENAMIWRLVTQPKDKRIFIISCGRGGLDQALHLIVATDPDPAIVIVHNDNDPDVDAYGCINQITKWPFPIQILHENQNKEWMNNLLPWQWDVKNCANDLQCRNDIASSWVPWYDPMLPVDGNNLGRYRHAFDRYRHLFIEPRHKFHPHEVNPDNYIFQEDMPIEKIYQISVKDIASENFPDWLENFLSDSKCSNNYNTEWVKKFHHNYLDAQINLQWFTSINQWRLTGELDDYLTGHSAIQGFLIKEILKSVGFVITDDRATDRFQSWYRDIKDPQWPDIVEQDFETLKAEWQQECIENFNYRPLSQPGETINLRNLLRDWRNMSIEDINKIYQEIQSILKD